MEGERVNFMSLNSNPVTLTRTILNDQQRHPEAKGDLTMILSSISLACRFLSNAVRKAGIAQLYGISGTENVQGETQKRLDVIANEIFINSLKFSTKIAGLASEEEEEIYLVENPDKAKYIIAFDPLDGSSNIDVNVSIGSIFAIWKRPDYSTPTTVSDFLRTGNELEVAGYCIYGSSTQLVLAFRNGVVNGFTLDNSIGEFILTHPSMQMPNKGNIYSINEGNSAYWDPAVTEYIHKIKNPTDGSDPYSLRYVGSMVSDIHRTILYGGIFMYPADRKAPNGKLRLLYEVIPMAFIIEAAGGRGTDGKKDLLCVRPSNIHERAPCFLGSRENIDELLECYARHSSEAS